MHEPRQTPLPVQGDTAKVLGIDGCTNVIRHDGTSSAGAHDGNQDIARSYSVAPELLILLNCNESRLAFSELIGYGVVDSEYEDSFVNKFAVQQLASEWAGPDCALGPVGCMTPIASTNCKIVVRCNFN